MRRTWYSFLYIRSPIAKIALGILSVLAAFVALLVLGIWEEPRMQAQTANWAGRSIEKGAEIFANNCASCHGVDGKGGAGPALNSKYFFAQRLADVGWTGSLKDYVALTVAAGRPSKVNSQWSVMMPTWGSRFGGPLRDDQVEHVTNYVLNWRESALAQSEGEDPWIPFQDTSSKAEQAAGPRPPQELFTSMGCSGCHNINENQTESNRGPIAPHFGNLYETAGAKVAGQDAETYVYNSIVQPNAYLNEGYLANVMPQNFAEKMSEEEIRSLVQWLLDPNRQQ